MKQLNVGDRVKFSGAFLRSIGAYTGPLGTLKGTVRELKKGPFVMVQWDPPLYFDNQTTMVCASNLMRTN